MFTLCVCSDFDMINFNKINNSKYKSNIEPLLNYYNDFISYFKCTEIKINSIKYQDVINILDQNFDGLIIYFDFFVPINYKL
jgi:hypothetical protein